MSENLAELETLRVPHCNVSWRNARQYHHEEGQKKIFAAVRSFRPSEGQKKSQKRAEGQNDLAKAQNFFLSFQMMRNVVH